MEELQKIIYSRKGGRTTLEIMKLVMERPYNTHQLAKILNKNYNTIKYHLNLLISNEYVLHENKKYGSAIIATEKLLNTEKQITDMEKYFQ